mgnify:CR=1 FL=1
MNCNCNRLFRKYHSVLTFSFVFSATQKLGPLVGIEKRIKSGLEYIEPDFFGDYVSGKCSCSFSSSLPIMHHKRYDQSHRLILYGDGDDDDDDNFSSSPNNQYTWNAHIYVIDFIPLYCIASFTKLNKYVYK